MIEDLRDGLTTRDRRYPAALGAAHRAVQGVDSKHPLHQFREAVTVERERASSAACGLAAGAPRGDDVTAPA